MIDRADANATCSESRSVAIKLATINIKWMLSNFNGKVIKSKGLLLLNAIKCNISFSFILLVN